jgi:hypothetical protein
VNYRDDNIIEALSSISSDVLNGTNFNRREFARQIINYPAMMVPSVQEPIIKCLSETLGENISLLDPFMGASNTLVTGMKYGLNVFGQDINPLSLLISQVKTSYYSYEELMDSRNILQSNIKHDNSETIEVNFTNIDKWFKKEVQIELSKLYRGILKESKLKLRKFYWVTLAEVIRFTSNDRTSTFKLHIRSIEDINKRDVSPINTFFSILRRSITDLYKFSSILYKHNLISDDKYIKDCEVVWGNSLDSIKTNKSFDLMVTSPPYGDNQTTVTYGQFSYLPLQWIPLQDIDLQIDFDFLKSTQEIDTNSLGGKIVHDIIFQKNQLFKKSNTLKLLFDSFSIEEDRKAKKLINFYHDLDKSIDNILSKLNNNSFLVWTVGNRNVNKRIVRNDIIIRELLLSKNVILLTDLERDISGKRMPGRNNFSNTMNKEKILIFKLNIN